MLSKQLAYALALAAGLALTSTARAADDVIRLAHPVSSSDEVLTLGGSRADVEADTLAVYRYGGYRGGYGGYRGGYYGGYRGYYGGYRGGYYGGYRGYYGGYRGYYGGYRGYYGGYRGYYRPYYSGYGYGGYAYGYGYGYYQPYYYGGYYDYCSDGDGADVYPICAPRRQVTVYYYTAPSYQPYQVLPQPRYQAPSSQTPSYQQAPQVMPRAERPSPMTAGRRTPCRCRRTR